MTREERIKEFKGMCSFKANVGDSWAVTETRLEALQSAITEAELIEKVEKKGMDKRDQLQIAGYFCLLQPCGIKKDEATGRCFGCKIGSSIKNAWDTSIDLCNARLIAKMERIEENLKAIEDSNELDKIMCYVGQIRTILAKL